MRRAILIPLLITIALIAIIGGVGFLFYENYYFYTTDDAQVNGQIVNVNAPAAGTLRTLSVKQDDRVTAGQTIGEIRSVGGGTTIPLTSPINGTIIQTSVVQGQIVSPGLVIAQVVDLGKVNVIAYVDENAINNVKVGQDVDVHIDAYSSTSYTGHVQTVVQAAASQFSLLPTQDNTSGNFTKVSQRIPVLISLDSNVGKNLVPGLSAEVTIHIH